MDILTRSAFYNQDRISIYGDFHEPKHAEKTEYREKGRPLSGGPGPDPEGTGRAATDGGLRHDLRNDLEAENGRRCLSIFEIDKLAEVLHVDYNALFAQDEPPLDI